MSNPDKLTDSPSDNLQIGDTVQIADSFRLCPTCGLKLSWSVRTCPNDGTVTGEAPKQGTTFKGQYEFLEVLGEGGMSVVYKARDKFLGRIVAIKLMNTAIAGNNKQIMRFQQEAKAASLLSHPNVINVFEFGTADDGQPYLIMDYAEGKSLAQIVSAGGRLPVTRALEIFIQVADALFHAHRKNVIHRDLKPSNIMLCRGDRGEDVAKVVDFGIAKIVQSDNEQRGLTQTGEVFGSPPYMSPEQCAGWEMNNTSDIYSMGCLMYEALTGRPPFTGDSLVETVYKHMNETPPPLVGISEKYPDVLEKIMAKTLEKDPADRYQTMEQLRDDLTLVLAECNGAQTPDGNYWCAREYRAKKRLNPIVIGAIVITVVAGILATWSMQTTSYSPGVSESDVMKAAPRESLLPNSMPDWSGDDREMRRLITENPEATSIRLVNKPVTDKGFIGASVFKSLAVLQLDDTEIGDHTMKEIAGLPKLSELSLNRTQVSNAGMEALKISHIKHLEIGSSRVTAKGLKAVAAIKSLQTLNLTGLNLTDVDLAPLAALPNLRELILDGNHISGESLKALRRLPLEKLNLANNPVTDGAIASLVQLAKLKEVDLSDTGVTDGATRRLGELRALEKINLMHTGAGDPTVRALLTLPKLTDMNVARTKVTSAVVPEIARNRRIQYLDLTKNDLSTNSLKLLGAMTQLKSLHIGDSEIDDDGVAKLMTLKKLESLGLENTLISDKSLFLITDNMKAMYDLNLSGTHVTNKGVAELAKLPFIGRLFTEDCRSVDDDGLVVVRRAHPRCTVERNDRF